MKRINENCQIDMTRIIGKGGFSTIYFGYYKNHEVAIKHLTKFTTCN